MRSALEIREMLYAAESDIERNGEDDALEAVTVADVLKWVLDHTLMDGYVTDHLDIPSDDEDEEDAP